MNDPREPGHPIAEELDDTQNPTSAAPSEGSRVPANVQNMLVQLQAMIDAAAVQAGPVMRQVAAKAAELAAVAGERAGPLAYKASEKTQIVGQKLAEKSKEYAADLRRQQAADEAEAETAQESGADSETPAPAWPDADVAATGASTGESPYDRS